MVPKPPKGDVEKYQGYGNQIETIRRKIMQIITDDPYAELLKEANERTFFTFQQNISMGGKNGDIIFDLFLELFKETKKKSDLIIENIQEFGLQL